MDQQNFKGKEELGEKSQKKEEEKSKRTEGIIWDLEKNLLVQADNIPKIWKIQ
ncbi:MAG: hypothetical protein ACLUD8_10915 [Clostridium sp.]